MVEQVSYQEFKLSLVEKSWNDFFQKQIKEEYFPDLLSKIEIEYQNHSCCPPKENIFRLFRQISLEQIKVVILGQDPYHQPEIADGIAFSTQKKNYLPPTLNNIFLELSQDLNCLPPNNSDLLPWVKEGALLLNTSLTVRIAQPLSHFELWQVFISSLVDYLKKYNDKLVWVFWGKKAQLIKEEHQISDKYSIVSPHPSPFSAKYGFFGSKPFSKINDLLKKLGKNPINWLVVAR